MAGNHCRSGPGGAGAALKLALDKKAVSRMPGEWKACTKEPVLLDLFQSTTTLLPRYHTQAPGFPSTGDYCTYTAP